MSHLEGARTPEMRKGRERLSVRSPYIEMALASLQIDDLHIEESRRFGNKVKAEVDRWLVGREVFTSAPRLSKADADRKFRALVHQQIGGGS